jgi:hypothetical protein
MLSSRGEEYSKRALAYSSPSATDESAPAAKLLFRPLFCCPASGFLKPNIAREIDGIHVFREGLYEALLHPEALVKFSLAKGSGGHREALARSLHHERIVDRLDEALHRIRM